MRAGVDPKQRFLQSLLWEIIDVEIIVVGIIAVLQAIGSGLGKSRDV